MRHTLDPPSPVSFGVPSDPARMTPSQRRCEIAAILARGILRLRRCSETSAGSGESWAPGKASESGRNCLERIARGRYFRKACVPVTRPGTPAQRKAIRTVSAISCSIVVSLSWQELPGRAANEPSAYSPSVRRLINACQKPRSSPFSSVSSRMSKSPANSARISRRVKHRL